VSERDEGDGPAARATGAPPPQLDVEGLAPLLESTSGRVQEVLRATDRAAEEILRGAQADADRYVREARERAERLTHDRMDRIASLTEDLMAQAGTIHRQAQDLRIALSQTLTKLSDELGLDRPLSPDTTLDPRTAFGAEEVTPAPAPEAAAPPPPPLQPEVPPAAVAPEAPYEPAAESEHDESTSLLGRFSRKRRRADSDAAIDEARIAIVQMLASGESRERIEQRLRDEFGIEDASTVFASPPGEPTRP
jgi:hypothetical protein